MSLMSFIRFINPTPVAPVLSARSCQWCTGALTVLLSRTESRGQTGPRAAAGDRDAACGATEAVGSAWSCALRPRRLRSLPPPEVKHADSGPRTGLPVTTFSDPFVCKWGRTALSAQTRSRSLLPLPLPRRIRAGQPFAAPQDRRVRPQAHRVPCRAGRGRQPGHGRRVDRRDGSRKGQVPGHQTPEQHTAPADERGRDIGHRRRSRGPRASWPTSTRTTSQRSSVS